MQSLVNFVLLGIIVFLLWRIARDNFYAIVPILVTFLVLIWEGISVAYLEMGAYSPELQFHTRQTGATARLVLALSCFLLAYWAVFRAIVSKRWLGRVQAADHGPRLEALYLWMAVGSIAAACVLIALTPPGVAESRSRALVEHPSLIRDSLLTYMSVFGVMLGLAAGVTRRPATRFLSYLGFAIFLLALYVYGNKFSGLVSFVFPFALSFLPVLRAIPRDRSLFGISLRTQLIGTSAFVGVLIAAGISHYLAVARLGRSEYLMERIFVLQGGIWWFTDYASLHAVYLPGLQRFIDFVAAQKLHPDSCLMYLMTQAIGWDLTQKIFFIDVSLYTGTFPSIFYVIGGQYGPPALCAAVGAVIGAVSAYLTRKILLLQVFRMILALALFLPVYALFDAGEFVQLYSPAFPIKAAAIVLAELSMFVVGLPEDKRAWN